MYLPRDEGMTIMRRLWRRAKGMPSGQGLVEYALILVLVAIVASAPAVIADAGVIAILMLVGPQIANIFSRITNGLGTT